MNKPTAYRGTGPYAFIAYSHSDESRVPGEGSMTLADLGNLGGFTASIGEHQQQRNGSVAVSDIRKPVARVAVSLLRRARFQRVQTSVLTIAFEHIAHALPRVGRRARASLTGLRDPFAAIFPYPIPCIVIELWVVG